MARTLLRFATGASTPLYLPLYVFRHHQGFQLQRDYEIKTSIPTESDEDGDRWAARQVAEGEADFAVCDPILAEENRGLRVVATLVNRMAFWAVSRQDIQYFDQFRGMRQLISYPTGMTGYFLARMIRKSIGRKIRAKPTVVPVAIDTELDALLKTKADAVALTANLLLAKRFVDTNEGFRVSPMWTLDPAFSSFMLTGLLARADDVDRQHALVKNVVQSLHRAIALVITDLDESVRGLQAEIQGLDDDDARYFVRTAHEYSLYPTAITPELTSWHNVRQIHIQGSDNKSKSMSIKIGVPSTQTFTDSVRTGIATEVERLGFTFLVRFGKGELYEDLVGAIEREDKLMVGTSTVVGSYCRFDAQHRDFLTKRVSRIRRAVMTTSNEDENYLIWGSSGSGKSFLIKQLGETLREEGIAQFFNLDLSKLDAGKFQDALAKMKTESGPILCLLDEIDASNSLTVNYTPIFPILRWRREISKQIVFAMVGSTEANVVALGNAIKAREKGPDLMTFVPEDSDHRFAIPDCTAWDRLIIFVRAAIDEVRKRSGTLLSVEKLALYYVGVTAADQSPRGLARIGETAAKRMIATDKLRYDDLFDSTTGEAERFSFYSQHFSAAQRLVDRYIELEG
jgi:ABC-type nitrate/sulfonate/bicarbonate transport system substrate-binding protein/energy-coupling factor transporter ATP-binding protein EcfA2